MAQTHEESRHLLQPGEFVGVAGGWPPLTVGRDESGYYEERLSQDLRAVVRREITREDAEAWLVPDDQP